MWDPVGVSWITTNGPTRAPKITKMKLNLLSGSRISAKWKKNGKKNINPVNPCSIKDTNTGKIEKSWKNQQNRDQNHSGIAASQHHHQQASASAVAAVRSKAFVCGFAKADGTTTAGYDSPGLLHTRRKTSIQVSPLRFMGHRQQQQRSLS